MFPLPGAAIWSPEVTGVGTSEDLSRRTVVEAILVSLAAVLLVQIPTVRYQLSLGDETWFGTAFDARWRAIGPCAIFRRTTQAGICCWTAGFASADRIIFSPCATGWRFFNGWDYFPRHCWRHACFGGAGYDTLYPADFLLDGAPARLRISPSPYEMTAALVWLIDKPTRGRYRITGLLIGLIWMLGRNHATYAFISAIVVWAYLCWERWPGVETCGRRLAWLMQGLLVGSLPMIALLVAVPHYATGLLANRHLPAD